MRFSKMHGIGNDFLFLDAVAEPAILNRKDLDEVARRMCDRHTGVGADGVIVVSEPAKAPGADVAMRIINSDGSEGGVCGNGMRCLAKLVVERGYITPDAAGALTIDIGDRRVTVTVGLGPSGQVTMATVDMGPPVLEPALIPIDESALTPVRRGPGGRYRAGHRDATFVSMGNPHMVAFIEEPVGEVNLREEGPMFEKHRAFPRRMNYHVVNVIGLEEVRVRTWERGAGLTLGCGSGACAVVVAGAASGSTARRAKVHMPGGDLDVRWDVKSGHVFMSGPVVEVFHGEWPG